MGQYHASLGRIPPVVQWHGPGYPAGVNWAEMPYLPASVEAHFEYLLDVFDDLDLSLRRLCAIYGWRVDDEGLRYWLGFPPEGDDYIKELQGVEKDHYLSYNLAIVDRRTDWRSVESEIVSAYSRWPDVLRMALEASWGGMGYNDEDEQFAYEQSVQSDMVSWEAAREEDKQNELPVPYPERVEAWPISLKLQEEMDSYMPAEYWQQILDSLDDGTPTGLQLSLLVSHVVVRYFRIAERWSKAKRSEQRRLEMLAALDLLDYYIEEIDQLPFDVKLTIRECYPAFQTALDAVAANAVGQMRRNEGKTLVSLDEWDADMDLMVDIPFWNGSDEPLPTIMPTLRAFIEKYDRDLWQKRRHDQASILIEVEPAARSPEFERTANYYAAIGTDYLECCARGKHAYAQFLGFEGSFEAFLMLAMKKPTGWAEMDHDAQIECLQAYLKWVGKKKRYLAHVGRCFLQSSDLAYQEFMAWRTAMMWREMNRPEYREWGRDCYELWREDPDAWLDEYGDLFYFAPGLCPRRD